MTHRVNYFSKTRRKNKMNATSQNYNGRWYHSKKEARYAEDLDWRIKAGEVEKWEPQVKLELVVNDQRVTNYFIDFKVWMTDGSIVYTEVKGFETDLWRLKWKITEALWPNIEGVENHAELLIVK